jgi:putative acetyltransferase
MMRLIEKKDNEELAKIIRESLRAYGLDRPGTVFTDPTTDELSSLFKTPGSIYWVATEDEEIIGGCGVFPTKGLPAGYAELVKLYLTEKSRGKGLGKALMEKAMESAREMGYTHLYLETFQELASAVSMYKKLGYEDLSHPLGDSGHHACEIWMLKDLANK